MQKERLNMPKKKYITKENVIMFPGTLERLKTQAHHYAENYQYDLAIEAFEKVLSYEQGDEQLLSAYAFSLFEVRRFEEARAICEELFEIGTDLYIEVMELYLSTCMELREFQHVEAVVSQLISENVIPPQALEQFEHIRALNGRIAEAARDKEQQEQAAEQLDEADYMLDAFFEQSLLKQIQLLRTLQQTNVRPIAKRLKTIIESHTVHPMVQSIALYILVEQEVSIYVEVSKFGHTELVNASTLELPENMEIVARVLELVEKRLEQEVSTYDMVQYLIARHVLVTYPFAWFDYDAEQLVEGYIDYVHQMFGHTAESDSELQNFLIELEKFSELPEA